MLAWFQDRFAEQLRDYQEHNAALAALIRRLEAIYLFGTIGIEAVLKSDGRVLVLVDEHFDQPFPPVEPVWRPASEHERTAALVIARKRIPEVAELLPLRPPEAANCPVCRGKGWLVQEVVCMDCGGLGWNGPGRPA
jgi:hypothetical protein